MGRLLAMVAARGSMPEYVGALRAAWAAEQPAAPTASAAEKLSRREVEVLQLIAQGLSNQEISERLVIALDTVKGHNQRIFRKLRVQRRTEAVARAHELGLL
jgi:LuxR family maltose regulon positive regulatory protein